MKKINFKKLYIKNFLSVGDDPIEIDFKEGFNIITGVNKDESDIRNGVGKSTIVSGFYFAIFGATLHDITNQSFIVNRKTGSNCVVRLEFDDVSSKRGVEHFVIERKISPKSLKIWKNDVEKTKSTIPETNKYIKEVLSLNEDVFKNCIIMQANNTIPFMAQRKTDRKNFIESIFNLSVFSDMSKLLKEDIKASKRKYDIENSALSVVEDNVDDYKSKIAEINKNISEANAKLKAEEEMIDLEIAENNTKIKNNRKKKESIKVQNIDSIKAKQKKYNAYNDKLKDIIADINASINVNNRKYKELCEIKDVCPTCKRPYDNNVIDLTNKQKAKIEKDNEDLRAKLTELKAKKAEIDKTLLDCVNNIDKHDKLIKQLYYYDYEIQNAEYSIKVCEEKRKNLKSAYSFEESKKAFDELLKEAEKNYKEKKGIVSSIEVELGKLNICEYILGDAGVRSFIVNKLLDLLNSRIKYYLNAFKSMFTFTFNEFFEEELKDSNGIICLYGNCSGAEQKKIDIAIIFAFIDILKFHQQLEYNVAFYDEILDSSLDAKSLEIIVNFIAEQSVANGKCSYIITHKSDCQLPNVNDTIFLKKVNGFTTRSEHV